MKRVRLALAAGVALALLLLVALPRGERHPSAQRGEVVAEPVLAAAPASSEALAPPGAHAAQPEAHHHHGTHPLTAEHAALYRDVDLLDGAWVAARAGDYDSARDLLAQHGSEYPSPDDDMRQGLHLLIDCMEGQRPDASDRAQHFYDTQTHSMMRRRIRRHCLER